MNHTTLKRWMKQTEQQQNKSTPTAKRPKTGRLKHAYWHVSELSFFGLRIFISRMHKRINIEDQHTRERCSLNTRTMVVQSDWTYEQCDTQYIIAKLKLIIDYSGNKVQIDQLDEGIALSLRL